MAALLLAEGGILADLGIHPMVVLAQMFIFGITFIALRKLLFGRIMDHMTAREAETQRAEEKIRIDRAEGVRLAKEVEANLARIDKEAWERLQGVLKESIEARSRITAEAQARAAQETKAALEVIGRERNAALETLRKEVPALAMQAAERILGVPMEPDAVAAAPKGGA